MISVDIFKNLFTEFYFGGWLILGMALFGCMRLVKYLLGTH